MLKRTSTAAKRRRLDDLRRMLEGRRAQLAHDVHDRIRSARSEGLGDRDVVDAVESSEVDSQGEIGFALIQLKSETLKMIDTALRRIEQGDYGDCFECGREIAEARTRLGSRLFGKTAQLLRDAACPVLAVPALNAARADDEKLTRLAA